jgi:phosphatidylglycerol lysyltransferase
MTAFALREWIIQPRAQGEVTTLPPETIRRAMAQCPRSAALALTGDKRFLVSEEGDCFLMFRPLGRTWVVMGDPVGPRERWSALVWELRRLSHLCNARLCFYQASEEMLPLMVELGLAVMKYGEEAIVDPATFTLTGPRMKGLRNSRARALREGLSLTLVPPSDVPRWLPRLKPVSDEWLRTQHALEKGSASAISRPATSPISNSLSSCATTNRWPSPISGPRATDRKCRST